MFSLVLSKFLAMRNLTLYSVCTPMYLTLNSTKTYNVAYYYSCLLIRNTELITSTPVTVIKSSHTPGQAVIWLSPGSRSSHQVVISCRFVIYCTGFFLFFPCVFNKSNVRLFISLFCLIQ